jgi:hypothetical protein
MLLKNEIKNPPFIFVKKNHQEKKLVATWKE